jgi:hypothetical protein
MEVFFCDRCSSRVTEGDLAEGHAFQIHTFVLCKACWGNSDIREALERRAVEADAVAKAAHAAKKRPGSGSHPARRKTPRSSNGIRRTPARGTPRRTPSRGTPRRTPVPQGRRRTPGRTSPTHLERVRAENGHHHGGASRHHRDAAGPTSLAKALAFGTVGLILGLLAIFFVGSSESPASGGTGSGVTAGGSGGAGGVGSSGGTTHVTPDGGGATLLSGRGMGAGGGDDDAAQDFLYFSPVAVANPAAGLRYEMYEGAWRTLPVFSEKTPAKTGTVPNFRKVGRLGEHYGIRFTGYIDVPRDEIYTFSVESDDGTRLEIGGTSVVENDGMHQRREENGEVRLRAGKHAIRLDYFQGDGGEYLQVRWAVPGSAMRAIPDEALCHSGG